MTNTVRTIIAKKPTKVDYYNFIRGVQKANPECKGASKLNASQMKALALKMGYLKARGVVSNAIKIKKEEVKQEVTKTKTKSVKPKKKTELTPEEKKQEKKRLLKEITSIKINVSDSEEVGAKKKKAKEKLMKKMREL